jgi:hypothetical protein
MQWRGEDHYKNKKPVQWIRALISSLESIKPALFFGTTADQRT